MGRPFGVLKHDANHNQRKLGVGRCYYLPTADDVARVRRHFPDLPDPENPNWLAVGNILRGNGQTDLTKLNPPELLALLDSLATLPVAEAVRAKASPASTGALPTGTQQGEGEKPPAADPAYLPWPPTEPADQFAELGALLGRRHGRTLTSAFVAKDSQIDHSMPSAAHDIRKRNALVLLKRIADGILATDGMAGRLERMTKTDIACRGEMIALLRRAVHVRSDKVSPELSIDDKLNDLLEAAIARPLTVAGVSAFWDELTAPDTAAGGVTPADPLPTGTQQAEGEKPPPAVDPFAELREFARDKLKGQERAVIEAICDAGGELSIADMAVVNGVGWGDPFQGFKDAQRRLNPKLKPEGWRLERRNNAGFLVTSVGAKEGAKNARSAPD